MEHDSPTILAQKYKHKIEHDWPPILAHKGITKKEHDTELLSNDSKTSEEITAYEYRSLSDRFFVHFALSTTKPHGVPTARKDVLCCEVRGLRQHMSCHLCAVNERGCLAIQCLT